MVRLSQYSLLPLYLSIRTLFYPLLYVLYSLQLRNMERQVASLRMGSTVGSMSDRALTQEEVFVHIIRNLTLFVRSIYLIGCVALRLIELWFLSNRQNFL